jgi:hypothetical protein
MRAKVVQLPSDMLAGFVPKAVEQFERRIPGSGFGRH